MPEFGNLHPHNNSLKKIFKVLLKILQIIIVFYGFILIYIQYFPAKSNFEGKATVVVVPGAGINRNSTPSPALERRLDKALSLYKNKKVESFFVSGRMAEVFVMKNYLTKHGVPKDKIIEDDKGFNTFHTIKDIKTYTRKDVLNENIVIVSQRYHLPRIAFLVHKQKMKKAKLIATDTLKIPQKQYLSIILREGFAMIKAIFFDN